MPALPAAVERAPTPRSESTSATDQPAAAAESGYSSQIEKAKLRLQLLKEQKELGELEAQIRSMENEIAWGNDKPASHPLPPGPEKNLHQAIANVPEKPPSDEIFPVPKLSIHRYEGRSKDEYALFLNRLNSYFQEYPRFFTSEWRRISAAVSFLGPDAHAKWMKAPRAYNWPTFKQFCGQRAEEGGKPRKEAAFKSRPPVAPLSTTDYSSNYGHLERPSAIAPTSTPRPDAQEDLPLTSKEISKFEGKSNVEYERLWPNCRSISCSIRDFLHLSNAELQPLPNT